jgi:hypothetical protein
MAARPKGDLDRLTVPKHKPAAAPASAPSGQAPRNYAHTLSLRLTAEQYRRLRRFVAAEEDRTGRRMTHQAVIEAALSEWLDRAGG